jgi:hypothetical protein
MSEDMLMADNTFEECMEKSGLADSPMTARTLVMAMLGELLLCAYWDGIRGATTAKPGEELRIKQTNPEELAKAATEALKYLQRTPNQKKWDKRFKRIRNWFCSLLTAVRG